MAGDPPSRRPSATPEGPNPPTQNPGTAANPGNMAGTSNAPGDVTCRNGKGPTVSSQSANQGISNQQYAKQAYQLTAAEQDVIRLNRVLAETTRQLEEAQGRRGTGRPRNNTSYRRNETEGTRTKTIHTVGQNHTGPVTRQAARTAD